MWFRAQKGDCPHNKMGVTLSYLASVVRSALIAASLQILIGQTKKKIKVYSAKVPFCCCSF